MTSITSLVSSSAEARKPLTRLINDDAHVVGGIYHLDYDSAVVLTDDYKKSQAGGIPRGGFLLAAACKQVNGTYVLEDQEVILLRVAGTNPLPNESELAQTRLEVVRDAGANGVGFDAIIGEDNWTRNALQQSAFLCDVLGTFYTESDDIDATVKFGADIDNVVASAQYQVFLPSQDTLSRIASYSERNDDSDRIAIGTVRFASTRRKAQLAGTDQAQVRVHVSDFIARKTAVFGMTRTGKSNTIKTLVTAVHRYASENEQSIGQLIFDPQGEYANINEKDGTGLRLLGDGSSVRIYKMRPDPDDPQERALQINFFDLAVFQMVWSLVLGQILEGVSSNANYIQGFKTVSIEEPDPSDFKAVAKAERYKLFIYGLLHQASVDGPITDSRKGWRGLVVTLNNEAAAMALSAVHGLTPGPKAHQVRVPNSKVASDLLDWIVENREAPHPTKKAKAGEPPVKLLQSWVDDVQFGDLLKGRTGGTGVIAAVKAVREFHSPEAHGDIIEQVWEDMTLGRLSIVDLSSGSDRVAKLMSERIVLALLDRASSRFRDGKKPVQMQVVVEEAHNLFERSAGKDVVDDPWVRLSKEAAKYDMGLIYATQEVSSVDKRILSNTSNWLIAHLNSDIETKELSHYYDFGTFAKQLTKVEDVGFVRLKTYTSPYIVPVQVAKFDHSMVNAARQAAKLPAHVFDEEA